VLHCFLTTGAIYEPIGDALSRWVMCRLVDACPRRLKQSKITALTSADLQRKDGSLQVPSRNLQGFCIRPEHQCASLSSRPVGSREKDLNHRHRRGSRCQV